MSHERALKTRKEELLVMKKVLKEARKEKNKDRIKDLQWRINFLNDEIKRLRKEMEVKYNANSR